MKRPKDNKKILNLFYYSAVLFYLAAIINFIAGNHNSMGFVWLGLGSAFLCLGSVNSIKSKENEDTKNKEWKTPI